jgi:hypothetical protein
VLAGVAALAAVASAAGTIPATTRATPSDAEFLAALRQIPRDKWGHVLVAMQRVHAGDPPAEIAYAFRLAMGDTDEQARSRAAALALEARA